MVRDCFRKWLSTAVLVGSLLVPNFSSAAGKLDVTNYTDDLSIGVNSVKFREGLNDGSYLQYPFPPSLEIYYFDSSSNKHTTAGVNISTNKTYSCPLQFKGSIQNNASNSIIFYFISPFPSNTSISASIQREGGFSTNIADVISFWNSNKNLNGYAFVNLPNITNAVDGTQYGSVTMTFGPAATSSTTFSVSIENGSKYGLSPTNFSNVPSGGSVTSSTSQIYYTNSPGIRTKITGLERKL